jgi:protein CWC15
MTTAHRPTWKAAVGKSNEGGWTGAPSAQKPTLSLPSHTKMKTRRDPALTSEREEILKKSLEKLRKMEEKKTGVLPRAVDQKVEEEGRRKLLLQTADVDDEAIKKKYDDADEESNDGDHHNGLSEIEDIVDDESDLDSSDSDESDDDSDDDEDEEAMLQAELAKIRAEREAAKAKTEAEEAAIEQRRMEDAALTGNPLLYSDNASVSTGKAKRRWNEDVVFRNQAKEPEQKKRFINDTVRNDFHKRFLNKFIR